MMRTLVPLALLMAVPAAAQAYVRAVTPKGVPWQWDRPTVTLDVNAGQPGPELSAEELVQAVAGAAAPWSQPQLACTSVQLAVTGHPEAGGPVKRDGVNRVVFRRVEWCPDPRGPNEPCPGAEILALTHTQVGATTGRIVEADIEVNAVDHQWSDRVGKPGAFPDAADLQNTLTHEIGHLLGFAHSCRAPAEPAQTDDQDQPVALCREAGEGARLSTMAAEISETDTERRTLTADDERGACEVYPKGITRGVNQQGEPRGGCAMAPGAAPPPLLVLLLLFVLGRLSAGRPRGPRPAGRAGGARRRDLPGVDADPAR